MSPQRLLHLNWYRRHRAIVGYVLLAVGVAIAIAGVYQTNKDNQQRIIHQACVSAKETRAPLIHYLETTLALNDKARQAHLLPPSPPALRKLQAESLRNLRTLTRVFRDKQDAPCPPSP